MTGVYSEIPYSSVTLCGNRLFDFYHNSTDWLVQRQDLGESDLKTDHDL